MVAGLHYDNNQMYDIDGCVICGAEHRQSTVAVAEGFAHRFIPLTGTQVGKEVGKARLALRSPKRK